MTNELVIKTTSKIIKNNIDEFSKWLKAEIKAIPTELKNEDDFGHAANDLKELDASEKALKAAKDSILNGGGLAKLTTQIDKLMELARTKRLNLEKQVKTRKDEIKDELVSEFLEKLLELKIKYPFIKYFENRTTVDFKALVADALKNKRTIESMKKSLILRVDEISMEWKSSNDLFEMKETAILAAIKGNESMFSIDQLMTRDDWKTDVEARLSEIERRKQQDAQDAADKIRLQAAKLADSGGSGTKDDESPTQGGLKPSGVIVDENIPRTFDSPVQDVKLRFEVRVDCGSDVEGAKQTAALIHQVIKTGYHVTLHKV